MEEGSLKQFSKTVVLIIVDWIIAIIVCLVCLCAHGCVNYVVSCIITWNLLYLHCWSCASYYHVLSCRN